MADGPAHEGRRRPPFKAEVTRDQAVSEFQTRVGESDSVSGTTDQGRHRLPAVRMAILLHNLRSVSALLCTLEVSHG